MLEGTRAFDIVWGSVTGTLCFAVGAWALARWLRERGRGVPSIFGRDVDPERRLYFAWGIFAMMMGGTNFGCRYIDHRYLSGVHEGFFGLTLLVLAVLVPRLALRERNEKPASRDAGFVIRARVDQSP